ncbi:hypothetical protein ATEIFO6365_0004047200 [Aspergillus terreus]|uniref:Uncharacterized protein n=1 Tax=Aspergillus terreus TaxID=33178 RepID=A0A5M3YTV6_ASPTE|nr:hypothetical protein ATETN484_0002049700 [Aspergillus terreus]GFF15353.1 hypothetical protein ATEIFO6365_0004047200 [Aspergillus terreus]
MSPPLCIPISQPSVKERLPKIGLATMRSGLETMDVTSGFSRTMILLLCPTLWLVPPLRRLLFRPLLQWLPPVAPTLLVHGAMPSTRRIFDDLRKKKKVVAVNNDDEEGEEELLMEGVKADDDEIKTAVRALMELQDEAQRGLSCLFLEALNVAYRVLRAQMSTELKAKATQEFNDPQFNVQVLLVTYAVGSLGLNLHTPKSGRRMKYKCAVKALPEIAADLEHVEGTDDVGDLPMPDAESGEEDEEEIANSVVTDRQAIVIRLHATETEVDIALHLADCESPVAPNARPPIPQGALDEAVAQMLIACSLIEWHEKATFNPSPVINKRVVNVQQSLEYRALQVAGYIPSLWSQLQHSPVIRHAMPLRHDPKRYEETPGLAQLVFYMGIVHKARIQEKKDNNTVYGVLTDSYSFTFVCMRNRSGS